MILKSLISFPINYSPPLMKIKEFVHNLATAVPPQHCTNPYAEEWPLRHGSAQAFAHQRRHNLQTYLQLMIQQQPKQLLVGEAPGYRGCRLTGIPFTSQHILATLSTRFGLESNPFQSIPEWTDVNREASATIVWRTINEWRPLPLLWNVFPFHPHQPNTPKSNRTPKMSEIALGRPFLHHLLHLFPGIKIVAVGKKAAGALARWELTHTAVRHPSRGGAKQFQTGMNTLQKIL
ncbi:uracil-DNA glycosylase [Candidatus Leptofilum sp.]|uniref:uracil-DNA glycosylase n=1 Tax=Candidatus Leptofilum sp. TaxID=3241576 RepID=UPI003B5945CC